MGIPNDAPKYSIPVVGGHSGATIVPLLSQSEPKIDGKLLDNKDEVAKVVNRIQFGGDEVVKAKDGAGSATVSQTWSPSVVYLLCSWRKGLTLLFLGWRYYSSPWLMLVSGRSSLSMREVSLFSADALFTVPADSSNL